MALLFKCLSRNKGPYKRTLNYNNLLVNKVFSSVPLSSKEDEKKASGKDVIKKIKSSIYPRLTKTQIEVTETFSTMELFLPYLIHSQMTRNGQILIWEKVKIMEEVLKLGLPHFYEVAKNVLQILPNSDLYIFEQKIIKAKHLKMVPQLITLSSIEAIVFSSLGDREGINVVTMKSNSILSLFNLNVGNEQITNKAIVSSILQGDSENCPNMTIDKIALNNYSKSSSMDKELMGNILLRTIAVYQIIKT